MWVNLINRPNQKLKYKDIKTCSFTKNRLLQHADKNELHHRLHHCHLWYRPEALIKIDYHIMEIKTGSITDSITTICSKGPNLY